MQLRQYFAERGVTVADFADAIGVSVQTVYRYVHGERLPRRQIMDRIVYETGGEVRPDDFFLVPTIAE